MISPKEKKIGAIFLVVLLLLAILFKMQYGFYTLLRICLCGSAILILYENRFNRTLHFYIWLAIAILYNPFCIVKFERWLWCFLNIITISYIIFLCIFPNILKKISYKKLLIKIIGILASVALGYITTKASFFAMNKFFHYEMEKTFIDAKWKPSGDDDTYEYFSSFHYKAYEYKNEPIYNIGYGICAFSGYFGAMAAFICSAAFSSYLETRNIKSSLYCQELNTAIIKKDILPYRAEILYSPYCRKMCDKYNDEHDLLSCHF